jgi:uncharacterized protein YigA (DUF484 family)
MPNKLSGPHDRAETATDSSPRPADIAEYLALHPDFLDRHPEVLTGLIPPAQRRGDNVLDLQAFLLGRLQTEVTRLKTQQKALIATSRSNLSSQNRIHLAVLAAIAAPTIEQLVHIATSEFTMILDVDVSALCLEADGLAAEGKHFPGIQIVEPGAVDRWLGAGREAHLSHNIEGSPDLFGAGAGLVRSQALLRLSVGPDANPAMLALGSRRATRFRTGQGTELLCFLAQALEATFLARLRAGI